MVTNRRHNTVLRQVMYQFKRQYGYGYIDVYKLHGSVVDIKTGEARVYKELHRFKRGLVIPLRASRNLIQSISKITADRAFVYGGTYDKKARVFILDQRETKVLDLKLDDWIVYRGKKYELKFIDQFEDEAVWVITASSVNGDTPEQIFLENTEERLSFEGNLNGEP